MKFIVLCFLTVSISAYSSEISVVIHGPGAQGTTYQTDTGTPIFKSVSFEDGMPVTFNPTPLPRRPASQVKKEIPNDNPVPYNNMDYWERPTDKNSFYNLPK
jgi:hypothetical protein